MEIRQIDEGYLEEYVRLAYSGYPSLRDYSLDGIASYREDLKILLREDSGVRSFGGFIDGEMVAVMKLFDFSMNIYGTMTIVSGLGTLAVDPFYKKRGLGGKMVEYFEQDARNRGITTTVLLPFRPDFYGKFGYGFSTKMDRYQVDTRYCPKYEGRYVSRPINRIEEVFQLHGKVTEQTHGMMYLTELEKNDFRDSFEGLKTIFSGIYDGDELKGYTTYEVLSTVEGNYTKNYIKAGDIITSDAEAFQAIFSYFGDQGDQVEFVEFYTQRQGVEHMFSNPVDTSFNYIANGYLQTNVQSVGLMIKILDLQKWWDNHGDYFGNLDDISWKVGTEKIGTGSQVIEIKEQHLVPLWFGAASFISLYEIGLLHCDPNVVERLRNIFVGDNPPRNNTDF